MHYKNKQHYKLENLTFKFKTLSQYSNQNQTTKSTSYHMRIILFRNVHLCFIGDGIFF